MSVYYDLTLEHTRRDADRIQRSIQRARQIPVVDDTERAMHHVHEALVVFEQAITHTESPARLAQLKERARACADMWDDVFERARDKGLAQKQGE